MGADGIWGTADDGLRLQTSSPAINAGSNTAIPNGLTTDFSGAIRIQDNTVDMGAYETTPEPLPLKLVSFTGKRFNGLSTLNWQTTNEEGVKNFELQRRNDLGDFVTVATISAKNAATQRYTQEDYTIAATTLYYRLKMVDANGDYTYSNLVHLSDKAAVATTIYPNPVNNVFTVATTNETLIGTVIGISDVKGAVVWKQKLNASIQQVDVTHLAPGIYFVKFANGEVKKLIKK